MEWCDWYLTDHQDRWNARNHKTPVHRRTLQHHSSAVSLYLALVKSTGVRTEVLKLTVL